MRDTAAFCRILTVLILVALVVLLILAFGAAPVFAGLAWSG